MIEMPEHRQMLDDMSDLRKLGGIDRPLDPRHGDHGINERLLCTDSAWHVVLHLRQGLDERGGVVHSAYRKPLTTLIASTNPSREITTPGGNAVVNLVASLGSRITKQPRSPSLRINRPNACRNLNRTTMSV